MSEPGKYVLLRKVQSSSKNIKKAKKPKDKKLKKKLEKVQPKKATIPKLIKQNETNLQSKNKKNIKKEKLKQQSEKKQKQKQFKLNEPKKNNPSDKVAVQNKISNKKSMVTSTEPKKSFGDDLSDRLKASRFRFINEQLYTQTSEQALEVFEQDDSAFTTYHEGYRKQIEQWPINPLDRIIKSIKKLYVREKKNTNQKIRFSFFVRFISILQAVELCDC